jgi:23S rRNA (uracil1939-C5)-methyltransferase
MKSPIQLTIDSLASGGYGVGRFEGKVIFVPLTAPGDTVRCEIVQEKERFAFGKLSEIIVVSSERTLPPCPVFGRCGGCQWQHISYGRQLSAKRDILTDGLTRIGHAKDPPTTETVPSPREYGWRWKVDLAFDADGEDIRVGFYTWRGAEIVPIHGCPVAHDEINARIPLLARALSALGVEGRGEVELVAGIGGKVSAHLKSGGPARISREAARNFLEAASLSGLEAATKRGMAAFGEPVVFYPGWDGKREIPLGVRPSMFVQANPGATRGLVNLLLSLDLSQKRVLELYSGIGTLTIPMGMAGTRVLAVESLPASVKEARRTARGLGIEGIDFISGDVRRVLGDLLGERDSWDIVVLDPPRAGAYPVVDAVAALGASEIVYVSCYPPTLARDVAVLIGHGYRLEKITPFDFFPETFHVEALCHMKKE